MGDGKTVSEKASKIYANIHSKNINGKDEAVDFYDELHQFYSDCREILSNSEYISNDTFSKMNNYMFTMIKIAGADSAADVEKNLKDLDGFSELLKFRETEDNYSLFLFLFSLVPDPELFLKRLEKINSKLDLGIDFQKLKADELRYYKEKVLDQGYIDEHGELVEDAVFDPNEEEKNSIFGRQEKQPEEKKEKKAPEKTPTRSDVLGQSKTFDRSKKSLVLRESNLVITDSPELRKLKIDNNILVRYMESSGKNYDEKTTENFLEVIRREITGKIPAKVMNGKDILSYVNANMDSWQNKMAKLEKKAMDTKFVGYSAYIRKHTGEAANNMSPLEKCDFLAKAIAAESLFRAGASFNVSKIHDIAKYINKIYNLDEFANSPELLNKFLQNPRSVREAAREIRRASYGVADDKFKSYSTQMGLLLNSVVDPATQGKEYQAVVECIRKIAWLSGEENSEKYSTYGIELAEGVEKYLLVYINKMKKSERFYDKENRMADEETYLCLKNVLTAVGVMNKYCPGSKAVTKRAVSILIEEAAKMPVAPIKKIDADNIYEQYHVSDAMWQKTAYQERHSFLNEEKTGLKVKLDPTTL